MLGAIYIEGVDGTESSGSVVQLEQPGNYIECIEN